MKDDERRLLAELQLRTRQADGIENLPYVRAMVRDFGMNENRAAYICEKWTVKGWYDYGVNVLAGWLTKKGLAVVL